MSEDRSDIEQRKVEHIDLCLDRDVESQNATTLLEEVWLHHQSLPELSTGEVDLSTTVAGLALQAPIIISGMTGGAERATEINRTLASVAEELGLGFGVGSQRAMLRDKSLVETYSVRDVAPNTPVFGNIGAVQAAACSVAELEDLVDAIAADALCVHLNPGQEIVQREGDRDFRGCLDGIARAVEALSVPVIVKETGCGLAPRTLARLAEAGVRTVDVSGRGGTTWVGVETLRARGARVRVGADLWDWGVPTAAAIVFASRAGFEVIGSGGLRTGLDMAKALALGASAAGAALPFLRAASGEGERGARAVAEGFIETVRAVMLLTGSSTIDELRAAPRVIGPGLSRWLDGSPE